MPAIGSTSICGMLRVALRTSAATSAPSMNSALARPSFSKCPRSALVLASFTESASITNMPPSLALADSACLSASARTFFGRPMAWLRVCGPKERPPPRNRLTRAEPWRAEPVPFWRYIFLPVRVISARFFTSCVPLCQLPDDTAVNDVGARLETENSIRHSDRPRFLALEGGDLELHITRPSLVSWQLWACFRPLQRPALLHLWALPAWLRPLRQAWRRALVRLAQWPAARPRPVRSAARLARHAAQLRRAAARPLWP